MTNDKPDILGIARYLGWTENGRQVYGFRGIGPTYDRFFEVFKPSEPIVYFHSDWPWAYNAFTEIDEKMLIDNWNQFIYDVEADND